MRTKPGVAIVLATVLASPAAAAPVRLNKQTVDAFELYARLAEERVNRELREEAFLWMDRQAEPHRGELHAKLRDGELVIEKIETPDGKTKVEIPGGMIHHWVGVTFIPGVTLEQTLAFLQNYDEHENYYKPEVLEARLLARDGNRFRVYFRFFKKKVISAVLNTEHDIVYMPVAARRYYSRSYSTRIAEVEDAGKPSEHEKPVGNDRGFLWRLYTHWRFEEKDGGTYVQCETITLSRDIPAGLGWLIGPFVRSVPRESLTSTLANTRAGLQARHGQAASQK